MTRLLPLALLLLSGCTSAATREFIVRCERAGGFYAFKYTGPAVGDGRRICAKELILPVEADSAK